jgi:hypothetical protein
MDSSDTRHQPASNTLKCPKCGADNVQRLQVVYESGISTTKSTTVGVATTGNVIGVGVAGTSGKQHTLLSEKFAPPKKPAKTSWFYAYGLVDKAPIDPAQEAALKQFLLVVVMGLFVSLLLGIFIFSCVGWIAALGVLIWFGWKATKYTNPERHAKEDQAVKKKQQELDAFTMKVYQEKRACWERSYYCNRCGDVFEWPTVSSSGS